jgi:hypothetical protein
LHKLVLRKPTGVCSKVLGERGTVGEGLVTMGTGIRSFAAMGAERDVLSKDKDEIPFVGDQ